MPRKIKSKKLKKSAKVTKKKPLKVSKKIKSPKIKKVKETVVSIALNQFDDIEAWIKEWDKNKKLPHNRIVCSSCKNDFISLKGIGMVHAMKKFDGDIKRVLTESLCKNCKPKEEYKPRVVEPMTREEMEDRRAEISASLPKMKFSDPIIIDLTKNKDACKQWTYFACHRPDIYLDYGCSECVLQKHCACPIKNINRKPDSYRRKKK